MSTSHTVHLHRVLRTSPEKVYRAFLEPEALARWIAPYGFIARVHHLEPKVGGTFKMSFVHFASGNTHSFGGEYLELVPNERLRYTDRFDDPSLPGVITVSIQLKPVVCGTDLTIEQANLPATIPVEMCYLGWQESLDQLAKLVETEIPTE